VDKTLPRLGLLDGINEGILLSSTAIIKMYMREKDGEHAA
jgi:hypothetical protein